MSKRSRQDIFGEEEDQDRGVDPQKVMILEAKVAEAERQSQLLRSFKLHKLRETQSNDVYQQSFVDPLLYLEMTSLKEKNNKYVAKVFELQKELSRFAKLHAFADPTTDALNKQLKAELAQVQKDKDKLQKDNQDLHEFIKLLKEQVLTSRKKTQTLQEENNKLYSQVFLLQQMSSLLTTSSTNGNSSEIGNEEEVPAVTDVVVTGEGEEEEE